MKKSFVLHVILLQMIIFQVKPMENKIVKSNKYNGLVYEEPEEKFIARVKNDIIPSAFTDGDLLAFCPQKTEVALLEILPKQFILKIMKNQVICRKRLKPLDYKCITLAPRASMIAIAYMRHNNKTNSDLVLEVCKIHLEEEKGIIVEDDKQEVAVLPGWIPRKIAFNKQGTHLMVLNDPIDMYIIFDVKKVKDNNKNSNKIDV